MKITINDHRKIFAVQDEFNKAFPKFKIDFFEKPSKAGSAPSKKMVKHASKTLGQCRSAHNKGAISITAGMNVAMVEQNFRDVFELAVQVFQKSGNGWVKAEGDTSLVEQSE